MTVRYHYVPVIDAIGSKKKKRDTHGLNSCTRESPGKLHTRVAQGKYLLFPKTMCLCGYIWRSNLMAASRKAAPSTRPRSSPCWWADPTGTGNLRLSGGRGQVARRCSWRLEVSLSQKTETWWAAPDGGSQIGRVREAASDCWPPGSLHGHWEASKP